MSAPYREDAIQRQLCFESSLVETFADFSGHIATAGEFIRGSCVVKQLATTSQDPRKLVVKRLRIQFARNAESRWIVEQGIDGRIGNPFDRF